MVTSGVDNSRNYAMRHYQQIFRDRAFGNFYDLLLAVTLSPVMGDYLDMVNNNKSNPAAGTDPNENYAREILQLFSVGTYLLNADGTRALDAAGKPAASNTNGAGPRGALRGVGRATLPAPEARGARKIDPAYGKLVEPVLYMTSMARAGGSASDGVYFRAQSAALGQFVFYAPSVFNYYPFDYVVPGTQLLGPEFGIQTSTTAVARANLANGLLFSNAIAPDATVYGATGTTLSLASYQAVAFDSAALADRLDRNLLGGTMSAPMRAAIVSAVNAGAGTHSLNPA